MKKLNAAFPVIILISLIVAGIVIFEIKQCPKKTEDGKIVKIAYIREMGSAPMFVAYEKGFFKKVGLNVELIEIDPKQILDVLITNRVNVTVATWPSITGIEVEKPGLIKLFGSGGETVNGESVSGLVVNKASSIQKIENLKGKIIATDSTKNIPWVKLVFEKIGFDSEQDIKIIEVGKDVIAQALINKQVDAVYTHQPMLTMLTEKFDTRVIETNLRAKYVVDPFWTGAIGVVTAEFAQKNPETMQKLFNALDDSMQFIKQHPNDAKLIAIKYTPLTEDLITKIGMYFFASPKEKIDFKKIEQIIDIMVDSGIIKQKVDVKSMFYTP